MRKSFIARIKKLLNIYPGESVQLFTSSLYAFLTGFCQCLLTVIPMSLFLHDSSAELLPIVYLGVSAATFSAGIVYSYFESRFKFSKVMGFFLLFLITPLFLFWLAYMILPFKWLSIALLIWSLSVWGLTNFQLWGVFNTLFTLQQGKRLFGLIGVWEALGSIFAGVSSSWLVDWMGLATSFITAIFLLGASLVALFFTIKSFRKRLVVIDSFESEVQGHKHSGSMSMKKVLKSPYIIKIFLLSVAANFIYYSVDFTFNTVAEMQYPSEQKLAGFLGVVFAIAAGLDMFTRAFLLSYLLRRIGLFFCLLLLPVLLILSMVFAISGYFFSFSLVFLLIILSKILDDGLRPALYEPATLFLYQPLPPAMRSWVHAKTEILIVSVATVVVSCLLMGLKYLFGEQYLIFLTLIGLSAAFSLVVSIVLRKDYVATLINALGKHRISVGRLNLIDKTSLKLLQEHSKSEHANEVIYCLETLESIDAKHIDMLVPQLLRHQSSQIRSLAIKKIAALNLTHHEAELLKFHAEQDHEPIVKADSIYSLASLSANNLWLAERHLEDEHQEIKIAAIAALLKYGDEVKKKRALMKLEQLMASEQTNDAIIAGKIITLAADPKLQNQLSILFNSPELGVRAQAFEAVQLIQSEETFACLIDSLMTGLLSNAAGKAIIRLNTAILPHIAKNFKKYTADLRVRLIYLLGYMDKNQVLNILLPQLGSPDEKVKHAVLLTLNKLLYHANDVRQFKLLEKSTNRTLKQISFLLQIAYRIPSGNQAWSFLKEVILQHIMERWKAVFLIAGCIYPRDVIDEIRTAILIDDEQQKGYAQELLQSILKKKDSKNILDLLQKSLYPMTSDDEFSKPELIAVLRSILDYHASAFNLIKMAALNVSVALRVDDLLPQINSLRKNRNKLLRETSRWAFDKLTG